MQPCETVLGLHAGGTGGYLQGTHDCAGPPRGLHVPEEACGSQTAVIISVTDDGRVLYQGRERRAARESRDPRSSITKGSLWLDHESALACQTRGEAPGMHDPHGPLCDKTMENSNT